MEADVYIWHHALLVVHDRKEEEEAFFSANLLASTAETKHNTTKSNVHPEHKHTTKQNIHKKAKARFGRLVWYLETQHALVYSSRAYMAHQH